MNNYAAFTQPFAQNQEIKITGMREKYGYNK